MQVKKRKKNIAKKMKQRDVWTCLQLDFFLSNEHIGDASSTGRLYTRNIKELYLVKRKLSRI